MCPSFRIDKILDRTEVHNTMLSLFNLWLKLLETWIRGSLDLYGGTVHKHKHTRISYHLLYLLSSAASSVNCTTAQVDRIQGALVKRGP